MKRRTKLFASISCLGITLAMLVLGVLAATQVTFSVTSNIGFTVKHVWVGYTAKVERSESSDFSSGVEIKNQITTIQTNFTGDAGENTSSPTLSWNPGNIEFTQDYKYIKFTIILYNYTTVALNVAKDSSWNISASNANGVSHSADTLSFSKLAAGSPTSPSQTTWTMTFTLNNLSSNVTEFNVNPVLKITNPNI